MSSKDAAFSEVTALLRRNESDERDVRDVESDLQRLLLMSRDKAQRQAMIQAQAVRRIVQIALATTTVLTRRYCAGILCNLAHSERGRLSASSCDRWNCVSHRHNCPLFMLLFDAQGSADPALRHLSAAALLTFSLQNECHVQLDVIEAMPVLLRLLDARDSDLNVYAAATLWNLLKNPLMLLKLETIHGVLEDVIARRLSDLLWTPLEPFRLSVRPTGERGTTGIIESSGENLNLMLAAAVSAQLAVVLCVENYTGRPRALSDQFRVQTPTWKQQQRRQQQLDADGETPAVSLSFAVNEGQSVPHFDDSGALLSRTCAVCGKRIKAARKGKRKKKDTATVEASLVCAIEDCGQAFHVACSRWRALGAMHRHVELFLCGHHLLAQPVVHYCDFLADNPRHELLLTELRLRSLAISRVLAPTGAADSVCYAAMLNAERDVVAVGAKKYRVPANSHDLEMFIVQVCYVVSHAAPSTQQRSQKPSATAASADAASTLPSASPWTVSFARDKATALAAVPGAAVFWPGPFLQDLEEQRYMQRSLVELQDECFVYEFVGESPVDRVFAFGAPLRCQATSDTISTAPPGLWTTLQPRKGTCMKMLAEQIGHLKKRQELTSFGDSKPEDDAVAPLTRPKPKTRKPHFGGKKLNRVAVAVDVAVGR
ncbi:hypothetical protein ATCC90586_008547 [Pythium insidiosum]|nr:hypothetical protein ATCC90586_008547 [Pythium insidiosum]